MQQSPTGSPGAEAPNGLSIGDVATATGISTETLRMWERRYGRPRAERLPSGHRRYSQTQVRWLRRVAEALSRGHRPHKVVRLEDAELNALLEEGGRSTADDQALARQIRLVREFRGGKLLTEWRRAWRKEDPVGFLDAHVAPLLNAVGRAWADGDLEVRHEHYLSELTMDFLHELQTAYEAAPGDPKVLLTTLAGELHGLGLHLAALVCSARGVPLRMLGPNTPTPEITRAAGEGGVQVVGLSVSLATAGVETDRALAELRALLPADVRLVVGGAGARGVRRGPRGVEYAATLAAWDRVLQDLT